MGRSNWIRIIFERSLIPLNSLLLFFLVFEPRIVLPQWLQVFGRMHPLALHFPIVLVVIFAIVILFFPSRMAREQWFISMMKILLLSAAITSSITALMGFALSRSEGYDEDALSLHKWSGVLVPFLLHLLYVLRDRLVNNLVVGRTVALVATGLISLAGHQGAIITHGENFLLEPITPSVVRVLPPFEDAFVYADLVKPILDEKCISCHNSRKSKGDLIMETRELFLKGGEEGVPWDTTKEDLGIMMRRIHLPLEQKEHMPPKGKPQLTPDEIFLLHEWVKRGANFDMRLADLLPTDTLYAIGKKKLPSASEEVYDFAAASESAVRDLNNNYRVIVPVAAESPALSATFYNRAAFNINAVKELNSIRDKVVELNLSGMNVKDEDIPVIAQFKNLRRLNLNFTNVTGNNLQQLRSLPNLKMLSLSGTSVESSQLGKLQEFPKLKTVYLWSTPAANGKLEELAARNKNITWYTGFSGDTVMLQLTPPILENEERLVKGEVELKLKHYIRGTVVRYTLNGKDPDSLESPEYKPGLIIDSNLTLKTKAFKPGWISSEILKFHFYKKTFSPDSVQLLKKPHLKYAGKLGATLNDDEVSDMNTFSGKWIGFQDRKLEALMRFKEPVPARNVTLSTLEDLGGWVFPPKRVEVWGGSHPSNLKLLASHRPVQPKEFGARKLEPITLQFKPGSYKYLKVVAESVFLPPWHPEKGKRAYVFVDELFVN
jgi:uncharacterized membrane protein